MWWDEIRNDVRYHILIILRTHDPGVPRRRVLGNCYMLSSVFFWGACLEYAIPYICVFLRSLCVRGRVVAILGASK